MSAITLKGPEWVAVRQHRRALWCALALVALAVAALITSRLWADSAQEALRAAGCALDSTEQSCFQPARDYTDTQWFARHLTEYVALGMLVLPGVVGAFVAGPMIARELESGTHALAWTQSITPARWLVAKLAVPAVCVLSGVSLLSLLFHWSWSTGPSNDFPTYWYEPTMFVSYGTVPVAHALLGLAVGTLTGLLVRRTVAAMSCAALLTGLLLAAFAAVRAGLWPVQTLTGHDLSPPGSTWQLSSGMLTASGERLLWKDCWAAVRPDQGANGCMASRGGVVDFLDVHPASHYWPLQLMETGIALALAALAVFAAFRVLGARHA